MRPDGWRVGAECLGAVGADGGGGAVSLQGEGPGPPMYGNEMVEAAEQGQVPQGVPSAVFAGGDVVDLAPGGGHVTPGEPAVLIAFADCSSQVEGDGVGRGGEVHRGGGPGARGGRGAAGAPR